MNQTQFEQPEAEESMIVQDTHGSSRTEQNDLDHGAFADVIHSGVMPAVSRTVAQPARGWWRTRKGTQP